MALWSKALVSLPPHSTCFLFSSFSSSSSSSSSSTISPPLLVGSPTTPHLTFSTKLIQSYLCPSIINKKEAAKHICRAAEYKFPDPIPEFADAETQKFRTHLHKKLSKKDIFGDSVEEVVQICTEIFSTFLHSEYGGPGTLLVIPFIDMADTINERDLPGGPQAARAAVKWAQDHVDKDWKEWTGGESD